MTGYKWGGGIEVEADCEMGFSQEAIASIFNTPESLAAFTQWMAGQTMSICDGRNFNHETREYEPSPCGLRGLKHGPVVYTYDVHRYLGIIPGKDVWN